MAPLMTAGSTEPVAELRHHAGIVRVLRYAFRSLPVAQRRSDTPPPRCHEADVPYAQGRVLGRTALASSAGYRGAAHLPRQSGTSVARNAAS
jgi:hypothetical protein